MSMRRKALPRNASIAPQTTVNQWHSFVVRHVKIHSLAVAKALHGRDMEEARELVLDYLDGFLVWLKSPPLVEAFKQSFYVSTTYIDRGDSDNLQDVDLTDKPNGDDEDDHNETYYFNHPSRHFRHKIRTFCLSVARPNSCMEARKNLEAYLVLWRSVYSICESAAHAPNRLAQLFDWEVSHCGPLFKLSRMLAFPTQPFTENGYLANVDAVAFPSIRAASDIRISEDDIADFYQDGIKEIEGRRFNFDDLNESSTFRIKASVCVPPSVGNFLPRIREGWIHKTFKEPEGTWAFVVGTRHYFPILVYNYYLTLGAWAWFERGNVDMNWILLADGIVATCGMLLELASKWKVYTLHSYFTTNLPMWSILFQFVLWIIGLGEIALWVLVTQFKVLNTFWTRWAVIIAFTGAIVLRLLQNGCYFFYFPAIKQGHHKYRSTTFAKQGRLFIRSSFFFIVITGVLVPLYYWFVVPTLKRSAPWTFCPKDQLSIQIQCWVGVIGLWIPLLSIILIMDFIAYIIVMSFYGLSLATSMHIGGTNEAAHSMMAGFRSFSLLLRKWTNPNPGNDKKPLSQGLQSSISMTTESSSPTGQTTSPSKKTKKRHGKAKTVSIGDQVENIEDGRDSNSDEGMSKRERGKEARKLALKKKDRISRLDTHVDYSESSDDEEVAQRVGIVQAEVPEDLMRANETSKKSKRRKSILRGKDAVDDDESDVAVEMTSLKSKKKHRGSKNGGRGSDESIVLNREEEYMYRVKIRMNPLAELHEVEHEMEAMRTLWYLIVDDLMNQDLISKDSAKSLYVALNFQDIPLGSKPKDIIRFFFSSLYSLTADHELDELPPNYLEKMPSLTQLIPSYGEAVVFETGYLCNRENKKVTNLEFLVLKYPNQWTYFYERMKIAFGAPTGRSQPSFACYGTANPGHVYARRRDPLHGLDKYHFPTSADEMLIWFLRLGISGSQQGGHRGTASASDTAFAMHPDLISEIRLWASLRGQTLYKTLRGSLAYRMALRAMYACTKHGQDHVQFKCQVILAHQMYGDPSMLRQIASDILLVYKQLSVPNIIGPLFGDTPFDLVFDWSPRDLQVQHAFRDKLAGEKNEEYIRRYTLSNIFTETEDICAHGEALKRLIDAKAGDCPISATQGFPFASVIAGLPTPTRIQGPSWLFKFKGSAQREFGKKRDSPVSPGTHGAFHHDARSEASYSMPANGFTDLDSEDGMDDLEIDEDQIGAHSSSPWYYMAYGASVVHNCTRTVGHNDALAWIRCFNDETGREFDFLIHRGTFDIFSISYFTIPSAQSAVSESTMPSLSDHSEVHDSDSHDRVYAVIKFGIRHAWITSRFEVFAIVTCVNEDQFSRFASDAPKSHSNHSVHEASVIHAVETQRSEERRSIARHLVSSIGVVQAPNMGFFSAIGKSALAAVHRFHAVLQGAATLNAFEVDANPTATDVFLGIEVRTVLPRRGTLILRVAPELPIGDPDRIQGKAANQMNGLRFGFGLVTQTKDANQGGNVAESMKLPIMLRHFLVHNARDRGDQARHLKHWFKHHAKHSPDFDTWLKTETYIEPALKTSDAENSGPEVEVMERSIPMGDEYERDNLRMIVPPAMQGFREVIFTKSQGTVARFQAYSEWTFGTLVQRVYSKLNIRMHYGHPDFFSSAWIYSRLMSKANPTYNLSEDIFAGYFAMLHGRRSTHTDQIQDEKGRDTSLTATATFTAKLAQGAASQLKSRDVFQLNSRLDFLRLFFVFHSSLGYYFTTTAMLLSVKAYLFAFIVFSLAGYSAENLQNLSFVYSMPFLVQVGMATLLPLFLEVGREEGVLAVLKLIADLPLSLGFYLFQGQTTTHHMVESFQKGKSHYEATGRLLGISRKSLVDIYQMFGQSHIEPAMDYLFYIIAYYIIASTRHGGYMPLFGPIICVIVFIIAPTGFQVAHSYSGIFSDVGAFGRWIFRTESFASLLKEWKSTPMREQMIKNLTWKATFQTKHTRLQTYSIFRSLKSTMTTHWRVDLAASLVNFVRVALWAFIIISVPGGMKDSILKIVLALALYGLLAMGISTIAPHDKKGCWYSMSVVFVVLSIVYFIAMFIILNIWRYIGESIIGVFVALKLLKSLSWFLFHLYAVVKKVIASSRWRVVDWNLRRGKMQVPDRDKETKALKADLEKNLLAGLFLVDSIDRPVIIFFLSLAFIPIHIIWSLLWSIPYLSHYLMYAIKLVPKKGYQDTIPRPAFGSWNIGSGFNVPVDQQINDLDELPSFNFDGDVDFYF